jgi:hypothetical protein
MFKLTTDEAEGQTPEITQTLDELAREGARRMIAAALEAEVAGYVETLGHHRDENGHALVVRNGRSHHERTVQMGAGSIKIRAPRVNDRRPDRTFSSKILPPYMRRSPRLEEAVPVLYLRGLSTGDFSEALEMLLGSEAAGFSATTITRLLSVWQEEYKAWRKRSLAGKEYVYIWADMSPNWLGQVAADSRAWAGWQSAPEPKTTQTGISKSQTFLGRFRDRYLLSSVLLPILDKYPRETVLLFDHGNIGGHEYHVQHSAQGLAFLILDIIADHAGGIVRTQIAAGEFGDEQRPIMAAQLDLLEHHLLFVVLGGGIVQDILVSQLPAGSFVGNERPASRQKVGTENQQQACICVCPAHILCSPFVRWHRHCTRMRAKSQ